MRKCHDIRVVVPSYADTSLYDENIELWKIRANPSLVSFLLDSINIFAHAELISKIWKFRPDILQIIDNHPWYFFYPLLGKCLWAKIYVLQHDPFPHSGEKQWLFHTVAIWVNAFLRKVSDKLIVHGEKMKSKVIETYKIPKEKVISIYHGSFGVFGAWEWNTLREVNTFLFFWRIVEYKWLDILLESLKILENEWIPYHAIIAWDGDIKPYQDALEALDKKHITLENRFIEDSEIATFFSKANFVVLPYKDATASWIIPLAYSFSLPVIATDVWVLSDYVKDGETWLLLKKPDAILLAEAIKNLQSDKEFTSTLGEKAKQFQEEHLSWEGIIASIYS